MKFLAVDLGNVICDVSFNPFIKSLSKALNVSIDDVNYFLNRTQKLHDLGLTDIRSELSDHFKIKSLPIIDDLMIEWNKTVKRNVFMVSTLQDMINKNDIKIALLSNIGIEHAAEMHNTLTENVFNNTIKFFSCEVGTRKPSYLYYKTFLDMYPDFRGCVYLDDRLENIEASKKFEFNAQHFVLDNFKSVSELANRVGEIKSLIG